MITNHKNFITLEQIELYRSLFRGREDVFAKRWEKEDRAGYAPAYIVDWDKFKLHKELGGNMANFQDKQYELLTDAGISKHLLGLQTIGLYPLLPDNSSYFLAADFDGNNWLQEAKGFIVTCNFYSIPAYLERSRSGNGAHIWIFFENAYSAQKSRKIALAILHQSSKGSLTHLDNSFDRFFPNQDMLSGKGFGNLIALPLQGKSIELGNTLFVNLDDNVPFEDQWTFLRGITKVSNDLLDHLYEKFTATTLQPVNPIVGNADSSLKIEYGATIAIKKLDMSLSVLNFLKSRLHIKNPEYWMKQRLGKSTYGVDPYITLMEDHNDTWLLPRGFLHYLVQWLNEERIVYEINNQQPSFKKVAFKSHIPLRKEQEKAVQDMLKFENAVLVAPPGSGKTLIGLSVASKHELPTLILVNRRQIFDQWVTQIQKFFHMPNSRIGKIGGSSKRTSKKVTVAMIQTFHKRLETSPELAEQFGTIIIDECHHALSNTYEVVLERLNCKYRYGLTATTKRKYHHDNVLFYLLGEPILLDFDDTVIKNAKAATVKVYQTNLAVPFSFVTDNFAAFAKIIVYDQQRNSIITQGIEELLAQKKKVLVLSERKEHLEALSMYLPDLAGHILITGNDSARVRKQKLKNMQTGSCRLILATGQLLGEGFDLPDIDAMVLAFPFSFEGKLAQYVGRIRRETKLVYDYHDRFTPFLHRQFQNRLRFYKKQKYKVVTIVQANQPITAPKRTSKPSNEGQPSLFDC